MSAFRFADGSVDRSSRWDSRSGVLQNWTVLELAWTMQVYANAFGDLELLTMFHKVAGMEPCSVEHIPVYMRGAIIAALTEEMAKGRHHNIKAGPVAYRRS